MKMVKTAAKVTEIGFQLSDGTVWVFALDMAAMALLEEAGGDAMGKFRDLLSQFSEKPVSASTELLYFGLRARQPEITPDEVRQRLPPTMEVLSALLEAIGDAMPEMGDAMRDPTKSIL